MIDRDRHAIVLAENSRLIALLERHGIEWRLGTEAAVPSESAMPVAQEKIYQPESSRLSLSTSDKVALFRRLFRGRTDVYPIRWESKSTGNRVMRRPAPTNGAPDMR